MSAEEPLPTEDQFGPLPRVRLPKHLHSSSWQEGYAEGYADGVAAGVSVPTEPGAPDPYVHTFCEQHPDLWVPCPHDDHFASAPVPTEPGAPDPLPLHLEGVTPRRNFNLRNEADFAWLADYFSGYHGVPGLRAASRPVPAPEPRPGNTNPLGWDSNAHQQEFVPDVSTCRCEWSRIKEHQPHCRDFAPEPSARLREAAPLLVRMCDAMSGYPSGLVTFPKLSVVAGIANTIATAAEFRALAALVDEARALAATPQDPEETR